MRTIDLNADMGESFGAWRMGDDKSLLKIVSSANIACGFHGGDPTVMAETVGLAKANGVRIGAHPSFPDLQGFGRRRMTLSGADLAAAMHYQIGALAGIARASGAAIDYVKPHGALNNMACEDADLAATLANAVRAYDPELGLMAPALSELAKAGDQAGLRVINEAFADRAYTSEGTLAPRGEPGAMIHDAKDATDHVLRMVEEQALFPTSGGRLSCRIDSICVHGDGPQALEIARAVREGLQNAGWRVAANA